MSEPQSEIQPPDGRLAVARAKVAMYENWLREHHPDCPLLVENIVADADQSGSKEHPDA